MNFERTVESFEQEYRHRWEVFLATGKVVAAPDTWRVPE
jgi:hypothetical protein